MESGCTTNDEACPRLIDLIPREKKSGIWREKMKQARRRRSLNWGLVPQVKKTGHLSKTTSAPPRTTEREMMSLYSHLGISLLLLLLQWTTMENNRHISFHLQRTTSLCLLGQFCPLHGPKTTSTNSSRQSLLHFSSSHQQSHRACRLLQQRNRHSPVALKR